MYFHDIENLLEELVLKTLGIKEGCRDNEQFASIAFEAFNINGQADDIYLYNLDGSIVDREKWEYVNAYNVFLQSELSKMQDWFDEFKTQIDSEIVLLKEHFDDYGFCVNNEIYNYKKISTEKIAFCESVMEKIQNNISFYTQNLAEELESDV